MDPLAVLPLPLDVDPEAGCAPIAGEAPIIRALSELLTRVRRVVVAVAAPAATRVAALFDGAPGVTVLPVDAGLDWPGTVRAALERLAAEPLSPVLLHDWRYPLTPGDVVDGVLAGLAAGHRVVVPVLPMTDSVKEVDADGTVVATIDRATVGTAQYPRGFAAATLADLLAGGTDPLAAALATGEPVATVAGHADAGRFILPADADLLEAIIATRR